MSRRTEYIFARFAAHYDNLWMSKFKGDSLLMTAKREWDTRLASFSDKVVKEVLEMFIEHREFPPSLSQMLSHCKQAVKRYEVYKPEKINVSKQEVARFYLKRMYQFLSTN